MKPPDFRPMLNTILILFRTIFLVLGGYEQVALENLALREQLAIFQRSIRRPKIRQRDRLFWVCLQKVWKQWKSALVVVRPETVLDWQRRRFKRYWRHLSRRQNPGRPRTAADVGKLVKRMAETNLGYVDLSFMLRNQAGFANRAVLVKREVYINFAESEVA